MAEDLHAIAERIRGALDEALDRKKALEEALAEVNREVKRYKFFLGGTANGAAAHTKDVAGAFKFIDVLEYVAQHPGHETSEIAQHFGAAPQKIAQMLSYQKAQGRVQGRPKKGGKTASTGNPMIWFPKESKEAK